MFTRTLYAMLCHDNFTPPRGMGFSLSSENSSEYKANMIGIKIVSILTYTDKYTKLYLQIY